jgi:hypothetical protein
VPASLRQSAVPSLKGISIEAPGMLLSDMVTPERTGARAAPEKASVAVARAENIVSSLITANKSCRLFKTAHDGAREHLMAKSSFKQNPGDG